MKFEAIQTMLMSLIDAKYANHFWKDLCSVLFEFLDK